MTITTLTSREFNQNPAEARKAAQHGPVFITDRGQPAHVLLSIDAYRQLTGQQMTLLDAVAQPPNPDEPDFEPGRLGDFLKVPDLL